MSGVSKDYLVRHMIMHRHETPLGGKTTRGLTLRPMAESRLYKIDHCSLLFRLSRSFEAEVALFALFNMAPRTPSPNRQRVISRRAIALYVRYPHVLITLHPLSRSKQMSNQTAKL